MTITHAWIEYDDEGNSTVVTDNPESDQLQTDWARLEAMTDEEIERNAEEDPDAPPLTDEQLARLRLAGSIRAIRRDLGVSQEAFADRFGFGLEDFKAWERGRLVPDVPTQMLLRVITLAPDLVADAVSSGAPVQLPRRQVVNRRAS